MIKDQIPKAILNDPKYKGSVIKINTEKQVRCPHCNRMIGEGEIKAFRPKCPNCKEIFSVEQI